MAGPKHIAARLDRSHCQCGRLWRRRRPRTTSWSRTREILLPNGQPRDLREHVVFESARDAVPADEKLTAPTDFGDRGVETCRLQRHDGSRVIVETRLQSAGWLVLNETFAPGWTARVRSNSRIDTVSVRRANRVMRAVALPPGRHRVTFQYDPPSVHWGLLDQRRKPWTVDDLARADHHVPRTFPARSPWRSDPIVHRWIQFIWLLGADPQIGFLQDHRRVRIDAARQPHTRTDDGIVPDDGFATQDGRIGVDHDSVFECRMAFDAADQISVGIGVEAEGSQRDTLIQFDVIANLTGFSDHDARPVVDEEVVPDLRSGMDVDPVSL